VAYLLDRDYCDGPWFLCDGASHTERQFRAWEVVSSVGVLRPPIEAASFISLAKISQIDPDLTPYTARLIANSGARDWLLLGCAILSTVAVRP